MQHRYLTDRNLSLKAKQAMTEMLNDPDVRTIKDLQATSRDGESSCRSALHELESAGYLVRSARRSPGPTGIRNEVQLFPHGADSDRSEPHVRESEDECVINDLVSVQDAFDAWVNDGGVAEAKVDAEVRSGRWS